jgi:hypothetical protein
VNPNDTLSTEALRREGLEKRPMTTPRDVVPVPESSPYSPAHLAQPLDEDLGPLSLFQEINERRARVENAELLQHLRGL